SVLSRAAKSLKLGWRDFSAPEVATFFRWDFSIELGTLGPARAAAVLGGLDWTISTSNLFLSPTTCFGCVKNHVMSETCMRMETREKIQALTIFFTRPQTSR